MEKPVVSEEHKQLVIDALVKEVFPLLKLPMFTEFEMVSIYSVINNVYKVITNQGIFIAKYTRPLPEGEVGIIPAISKQVCSEVLKENGYGVQLYYFSDKLEIFEFIENDAITFEE